MYRHAKKEVDVRQNIPNKLFYKIGEVSKITGVESYVLRYWESEFAFINPRKNKSGQRVYIKKDIDLILMVKRLLYDERYTIEGVKKKFEEGILQPVEINSIAEKKDIAKKPSATITYIIEKLKKISDNIK